MLRTTINIKPETLDVFRRMAALDGRSVAQTIGDWLEATAEGAEAVSEHVLMSRRNAMGVVREMNQALPHLDKIGTSLATTVVRDIANKAKRPPGSVATAGALAPSSNTGLKSARKNNSGGRP